MQNNVFKKVFSLFAAVILLLQPFASNFVATAQENQSRVINIRSAADFLDFADNCRLDTWSDGLVVSLDYDISLKGRDFDPVPIFKGSFNGNGHTISGVKIKGKIGEAGLFGILAEDARVYNLNVSGTLSPRGEIRAVGGICAVNSGSIENCSFNGTIISNGTCGGICGINERTGVVSSCSVIGKVTGLKKAGGIVGNNLGMIKGCSNSATINSAVTDRKPGLKDLKFESISDIKKLFSLKKLYSAEGIGGICGFNSGTVYGCSNNGEVGKNDNGYNVGGICGLTSGLISQCRNSASIYGNINIGGIAGIVVPYVTTGYTEDLLTGPRQDIKDISDLVNNLLLDIDSCVNGISDCIAETINGLNSVMTNLKYLELELSGVINTKVAEIMNIPGSTEPAVRHELSHRSGER